MSDNIIHAFPAKVLPDCPVDVERPSVWCLHPAITIVEHDRLVICSKCGAAIDPYEYLRSQALAIRRGWDAYRMVMHQEKQKRDQVEQLDKVRKRLAAQVKRLQAQAPGVSVDLKSPAQ